MPLRLSWHAGASILTCCCISVVFVRAVNTLLVTRASPTIQTRFPPNGVTYQGGGLPDQHRDFYQVGKSFRVAGFLATSFVREVAEGFMCFADRRGEPCVLWEIHVDPAGERSPARRCKHVNYVTRHNIPGEEEYLYAPYSPFTVREVSCLRT